ncbi:DUF2721 domain-containing protein [Glacieibacterium frigidum]|uniref:DUF2721 domain-containing protein n=2 Tax=Glacieibacterium frigidum TaxID=2593303 RepID=A0A552UH74_9SPHN|nr:DUF2721 domain-containing protein [Glacieibacterium frigidum]
MAGMALPLPVDAIAHNIQLATAPVFLLAGIGSFMNVLTTRLGRVIDRARLIEAEIHGYDIDLAARARTELRVLGRRMTAAHWAIGLCTLSALLVCVVVAALFVGDLIPLRGSVIVAALFVGAMILLIGGLLLFLIEVQIAMRSVKVRGEML